MQTINKPRLSNDGKGPKPLKDGKGPLSTKSGSVVAAVVTAVLAAAVIVLFIQQYKKNINDGSVPTPVLVADAQIEKGASANALGEQGLFKLTEVPKDKLKAGAISDAETLGGQVAVADILPGQQLTTADFAPAGSGVVTKLAPEQRAIALPLDRAHGLLETLKVGDHVDIMSGFLVDNPNGRPAPVLRTIAQDVLVLKVPESAPRSGGATSGSGNNNVREVTVRVPNNMAPKIAFASQYGKVWLVLRPQNGEDVDRRSIITIQSLLQREAANETSTQDPGQ